MRASRAASPRGGGELVASRRAPSADPDSSPLSSLAGSRVFAALVAGCVAGVLGLTDIRGFLAYLLAMALVRLRRAALRAGARAVLRRLLTRPRAADAPVRPPPACFLSLRATSARTSSAGKPPGSQPRCPSAGTLTASLLPHRRQHFLTGGIFDGAMTYILFWTCVAPLPAPTRAAAALRQTRAGVVSFRLIRAFSLAQAVLQRGAPLLDPCRAPSSPVGARLRWRAR